MSNPEKAQPPVVKVTVQLPRKVWEAWDQLASCNGISKTEMLRRAISTEKFRNDVISEGGRFLVLRADGEMEKIVFPY